MKKALDLVNRSQEKEIEITETIFSEIKIELRKNTNKHKHKR